MSHLERGDVVWSPGAQDLENSNLARFRDWLRSSGRGDFKDYWELWRWSVNDLESFWASVAEHFAIAWRKPYSAVLPVGSMPGAKWFEGSELNFAERLLAGEDEAVAVVHGAEDREARALTRGELRAQVAAIQGGLRRLGVRPGDRVAAYLPNIPETLAAFIACAGLGAIWSSCSPEFGVRAVIDRFGQIAPKVLLGVDGYRYGGQAFDRRAELAEIARSLPGLEALVVLPRHGARPSPPQLEWTETFTGSGEPVFESLPFDHPLWIVYSSGTTGLPKPIVHGHGGILLESLVQSSLHLDLQPQDRFFWFSTTGWVMWNIVVSSLAVGAAALLYDGSPAHPDLLGLWRFAGAAEATFFGTGAAFLQSCAKAGLRPADAVDLAPLSAVGSTGSPLPAPMFEWIGEAVKPGVFIANISGGTDVCGAFLASSKLLPVRAGELQCPALGASLEAFDAAGRPIVGEVGELVVTRPMPSMPLGFWNDADGSRFGEAYFDVYPGVWRHGDWIEITASGGAVIYGRSDSTLNRGGVRMGTADFYRVVEELPEVADSLVVDTSTLGTEGRLVLFVALASGVTLDAGLEDRIRRALRTEISPRHVPDAIVAVREIPRTINGKKLELPVKRILAGAPPDSAVSLGAMANPDSLAEFVALAVTRSSIQDSVSRIQHSTGPADVGGKEGR